MKSYTVKEATNLKEFTDNVCAQASFRFHILLKEGRVKVNGARVAADIPLQAGDRVDYLLTPKEEAKTAFTVLYQDENVTVIDKADGVNSEAVFSALCEDAETYFIHRLDRNTAGVMIFARTPHAAEELYTAFREHRARKIYHALVVGKLHGKHAVKEACLLKDGKNSLVTITPDRGERIVTEYEVLEEGTETSLLKVTLHTGKTHQIRAHLAYLKHPVVGDGKYGDGAFNRAHHATRQRLVAKLLTVCPQGALAYLSEHTFYSSYELELI